MGLKDSRRQLAFLPGFSSGSRPCRSHSSLPQIPPMSYRGRTAVCCPSAPTPARARAPRCVPWAKRANGAAPEPRGRIGPGGERGAAGLLMSRSAVTHSHCLYLAVTQRSLLWCDTSCNKISACLSRGCFRVFFFPPCFPPPPQGEGHHCPLWQRPAKQPEHTPN